MKQSSVAAPVLLDEVILRCSGSREAVDGWLTRFRVEPSTDWAGRPVIPAAEAERIMQAYRQAAAEAAELQSGYDAYLRDRERRLVEAGDVAYRQVAEAELAKQFETKFTGGQGRGWAEGGVTYTTPLTLWPFGRQKAREAALEAREKFEKENPQLRYEQWVAQQKKRRRR
jgi:hypothetical protein